MLIAPNRRAVLATIGYRHISGIKQWEPYQQKLDMWRSVSTRTGSRSERSRSKPGISETQVRSKYRNYGLAKAAEDAGVDGALIQESFGVWDAAMGRVNFGGTLQPLTRHRSSREPRLCLPIMRPNFEILVGWLFGPNRRISDSRQLSALAEVVSNGDGLATLRAGGSLADAQAAQRRPTTSHERVIQFLTTSSQVPVVRQVTPSHRSTTASENRHRSDDPIVQRLLSEIRNSLEAFDASPTHGKPGRRQSSILSAVAGQRVLPTGLNLPCSHPAESS